jgi:peptidoglycan/LPS O-acetylase OafA/YrhL
VVLALLLVDAVVGIYFVAYAVQRERRDKPAVLVTGIFLLCCATALGMVAIWPEPEEPGRLPPLTPLGELA